MYNVKLNQILHRMINFFYLLGIWQRDEESSFRRTGRKLFFMLYYFLFQIFLVTCAFLSESSNGTIFLLAVEILLSVVTIKLMYLLWKKDEILAFLFDPIVSHSTADAEAMEFVNRKMKKFLNFVYSYLFLLGNSFVFYIISTLPMFSNGRKLPFFISFTMVGSYSDFAYGMAYVFVMSEIFFGFSCTLINVVIWYILFNYSLEYHVLGYQLRNLGTNKITKTTNFSTWKSIYPSGRTEFHQNLVRLIRRHANTFQTIARFKSCFSKLFLAQITTSGITICISAYVLAYSSNDNVFQIPIFTAILIYGIFDIFLAMYLANDIDVASDKLSYRLFESGWIGQPKSCIKCLLILGETVRHSQQLVILKIYPMNLETFIVIVKGAYSMFNLLQKVNQNRLEF